MLVIRGPESRRRRQHVPLGRFRRPVSPFPLLSVLLLLLLLLPLRLPLLPRRQKAAKAPPPTRHRAMREQRAPRTEERVPPPSSTTGSPKQTAKCLRERPTGTSPGPARRRFRCRERGWVRLKQRGFARRRRRQPRQKTYRRRRRRLFLCPPFPRLTATLSIPPISPRISPRGAQARRRRGRGHRDAWLAMRKGVQRQRRRRRRRKTYPLFASPARL